MRYGIDATKMKGQLRELMVRQGREWRGRVDRVVFNFPHVGGRSKDINRQARYNQGICSLLLLLLPQVVFIAL